LLGIIFKNYKKFNGMRPEELEDFVLENAILVSKSQTDGKNVFIYIADDVFFKVETSPGSSNFETIEPVPQDRAYKYFRNGEVRDLFYQKISGN